MPLLFLYAPPFIIAKRRLQSGLFCISADLSYNSRELTKITGTCLLQIRDFFQISTLHTFALTIHRFLSAHLQVSHIPVANIDGKLQNGLSHLIHDLSSSHSPIRSFFQLNSIVAENSTVAHRNFPQLLIRDAIRFHGNLIPIRFYLHPIMLYPASLVPVLERIDFQCLKIH